jgi:hypothetical protein
MTVLRHRWPWLLSLLLIGAVLSPAASAQTDPLRLVPAKADFVVKIENPSQIYQSVYDLHLVKDFLKIQTVQELYDSTNARRINQLISYFEKELGADRQELLDKLAGNGAAFALKIEDKTPVLFILQGKDEATVKHFVKLAKEIAESELARLEVKQTIKHKVYEGLDTYQFNQAYLAVAGSALIVSNQADALKASVDMYLGKSKEASVLTNKSLGQARKMLPPNPQAWAWLNLKTVQKLPGAKEAFKTLDEQPKANHLSPFVGQYILVGKSPFVCAGFYLKDGNRFEITVQFPRGLDALPKDLADTIYPIKKEGSLPLLEPRNVLFSTTYYLDPAKVWKNREAMLPPEAIKVFVDFEKDSGRYLGGTKIGQMMEWSGSHQRVVVAEQTRSVYKKKKSTINIPSFALVHEMRDEKFAKAADRILRTVALFGAGGFDVKLTTVEHNGVKLVSYSFPEDKELKADEQDIRYSFSPTYAWVGNQFVASSTLELAEDLVDELLKEKKPKVLPFTSQSRFYGSGLGVLLKNLEDQLIPFAVLGQALSPDEARKEIQSFINLANQLGTLQTDIRYNAKNYRMNIVLDLE